MDRSQDPSPFPWLLVGVLVLVGLRVVRARRSRSQRGVVDDVWAPPARLASGQGDPVASAPAGDDDSADEVIGGHPS